MAATPATLPARATASPGSAEAAWRALVDGGHVALMRHARAPGTGDPPGFRLGDCATQRNLSAAGRAAAERTGAALRARGVRVEHVYASAWCRALDTARLLGVGAVTVEPRLNSFFNEPAAGNAQMAALRPWIAGLAPDGAVVLVTHQVVVTALTGIVPGEGEIVVVRPGGDAPTLAVVGRIPPP